MKTFLFLAISVFASVFSNFGLAAESIAAAGNTDRTFQPFTVPWSKGVKSVADASFLLSAPAGHDGFIRVKDGHFVRPDGQRFRIWGLNATMQAAVPPKGDAPVIAANLAQRGINCIRFHFLDRPAPTGLIATNRDDTRALDPRQLDKLDFFIAELKKRGIYADLNLNVGRTYKAGDGVKDYQLISFPKALTYFDERLIELQKQYARQLLTHFNGYTGAAYKDEPAVLLVEFVNENSIVEAWFSNRLLGRQTNRPSGTWVDIPPSYAKDLTERYNAWLKQRVSPETLERIRTEAGAGSGEPVPRLRNQEFAKASKERFHTEASFYMELERNFFLMMSRYLKNELGVKSILVGNSDHNHGRSGYPLLAATSLLDAVDGHVYWQHPRYLNEGSGRRAGFEIPNTPMVDDPLHSTVVQLSRSAVAGKPYTVSEVNHPFPAEFACESIPILAAYGALQDWDGIFWYTLAHRDILSLPDAVGGHFDFAKDPVKMTQLAAGAMIFLRGDVSAAKETIGRSYTAEQVRESLRLGWSEQPYFTPGFPLAFPLQHMVRITSLDGAPTQRDSLETTSAHVSDTKELIWVAQSKKSGLVTINTLRSQAFIGFCGTTSLFPPGESVPDGSHPFISLQNLGIKLDNSFAAVTLHSLDSKPISSSTKLLLTATARVFNSGMDWNEKRTSLENWGAAPTLIESVVGSISLHALDNARAVLVQPLAGDGQPLGKRITCERTGEKWRFPIGQPATTWYAITVSR